MLKKVFVILFITVLSVRPAYFVGTVIYYKTNINEIVEKYCVNKEVPELNCNGKCHLAKTINKVSSTSNIESTYSEAYNLFFPVFYQTIKNTNLSFKFLNQHKAYFYYSITYQYLLTTAVYKPPVS